MCFPSNDPPSMNSRRTWISPLWSNMSWHLTTLGLSTSRRIWISRQIWSRTDSSWLPWINFSAYSRPVGLWITLYTVPPAPLPIRFPRSSSEKLIISESDPDGAELGPGGRGKGTAREVSRLGIGRLRSGRRRSLLAAVPEGGWIGLMISGSDSEIPLLDWRIANRIGRKEEEKRRREEEDD